MSSSCDHEPAARLKRYQRLVLGGGASKRTSIWPLVDQPAAWSTQRKKRISTARLERAYSRNCDAQINWGTHTIIFNLPNTSNALFVAGVGETACSQALPHKMILASR